MFSSTSPRPTKASQIAASYLGVVGCEVGFWIVLLAGLACRYLLRRPRLGAALLIGVPLVDLILLVASIVDLKQGGQASFADTLAAIYLGVSVAWGHSAIRWADARFAPRFAGGPAPLPRPRYGPEHADLERRRWARHLLAWVVGCLLLLGGVTLVGDIERAATLIGVAGKWTIILAIDFLISFSYTLLPRRVPQP